MVSVTQLTPMPPEQLADPPASADTVLEIKNLQARFFLAEGTVKAVDDVSLSVTAGTTLGIVGESGCGKSVTARAILQILPSGGRITDGQIFFSSRAGRLDLAALDPKGDAIRAVRGREIAMIFQEPMAAFSPAYTVGAQIIEAIRTHDPIQVRKARVRVIDLLGLVGIPQPERVVDRFPFELSGGLLQRAMIAMALSCEPSLLIADEPTTALDVTVQAQILTLLKRLQAEMGMSMIIISHNMGVIAEMADLATVMYLGRVVESAPLWDLFDKPQHPYTQALLRSIPRVTAKTNTRLESIEGNVPSPYAIPSGCRFHPRCTKVIPHVCEARDPALMNAGAGHQAACFLIGDTVHDSRD